jgi:hypothetical protein
MSKAEQYFDGVSWQQFGLTTEDITLNIVGGSSGIANIFYTIKDSNDNMFVFCGNTTTSYGSLNIIKIDKSGNKTIVKNSSQYNGNNFGSRSLSPTLSRDESIIYCMMYRAANAYSLYAVDTTTLSQSYSFGFTTAWQFAIYQDRFIWVANGTTLYIYDYVSKSQLDSETIASNKCLCCDTNNVLYLIGGISEPYVLTKAVFNGINTIVETTLASITGQFANAKQMIIDKWGDLIILTNSGTVSTLLKYKTDGTQIGTALTLSAPSYNLNTDYQGNYYYSNYLSTYKIPANTESGQEIVALNLHQLFRNSGCTTYGNNMTSWNPGVNG